MIDSVLFKKALEKVYNLQERIDKAIKYIEEFDELVGYNNEGDSYSNTEKKLLDILKGSDKNVD